ncbi:hypothetical protein DESC_90056 [Desulfosarcina cetonica]|nr:hypothetical protein DESC_90056 [Desulfosarcina cetonica]
MVSVHVVGTALATLTNPKTNTKLHKNTITFFIGLFSFFMVFNYQKYELYLQCYSNPHACLGYILFSCYFNVLLFAIFFYHKHYVQNYIVFVEFGYQQPKNSHLFYINGPAVEGDGDDFMHL